MQATEDWYRIKPELSGQRPYHLTGCGIYLPYVDDVLLVLDLLEIDSRFGLTGTLIEAALDPAGFFGRRGVWRVIRVGPGETPGPESPTPIEPTPGPDRDDTGARVETKPEPKPISGGQGDKLAALFSLERGAMIHFASPVGVLDWVLVPHVTPAPKENLNAFRKELRRVLGLKPGYRITTKRLLQALSSRTSRKELRNCYDAFVAHGARCDHNRISMSLYSGPTGRGTHDIWRHCYQPNCLNHRINLLENWYRDAVGSRHVSHDAAVGWLGTGDAMLKRPEIWQHFEATYKHFFKSVALLGLPHHGSRHNFRSELIQGLPDLRLAVANAAQPSRYRHPHFEVVRELKASGIPTLTVSQDIQDELRENIWQES